ncbi:RNA-binding S4 domain-containing protein [Chitinimonas viridis]|uniref:RNA-binding S4 domain-containing protein n=1 Tax=Chitinimonas viridis TaxID=664880 RepID=A0ABT8B918_9NEIS|nr:RNA-binding S4 domain-containing protein [Chitinimonas viridis]MBL8507198.1 RNA-binding S4 domain-containing protein [Chitinimonas sp.]MDN3578126.1 RNA-binding S4 domain-containing protein [Chitinimonas viridis]
MNQHTVELKGEYIELHNLLKFLAIADSGGQAKMIVAEGLVEVDGEIEFRKTRKVYAGSVVKVFDEEIQVVANPNQAG